MRVATLLSQMNNPALKSIPQRIALPAVQNWVRTIAVLLHRLIRRVWLRRNASAGNLRIAAYPAKAKVTEANKWHTSGGEITSREFFRGITLPRLVNSVKRAVVSADNI